MFKSVIDALVALVFVGFVYCTASGLYKIIRKETIIGVSKGLSDHYRFTKALTKKAFDWEY